MDKRRQISRRHYLKHIDNIRVRAKAHKDANREKIRSLERIAARKRRMRKMGLTEEHLAAVLVEQNHVCAICQLFPVRADGGREMALDHCHKTGRFRGVLCNSCNTALGKFNDDASRLERAISYLAKAEITPLSLG